MCKGGVLPPHTHTSREVIEVVGGGGGVKVGSPHSLKTFPGATDPIPPAPSTSHISSRPPPRQNKHTNTTPPPPLRPLRPQQTHPEAPASREKLPNKWCSSAEPAGSPEPGGRFVRGFPRRCCFQPLEGFFFLLLLFPPSPPSSPPLARRRPGFRTQCPGRQKVRGAPAASATRPGQLAGPWHFPPAPRLAPRPPGDPACPRCWLWQDSARTPPPLPSPPCLPRLAVSGTGGGRRAGACLSARLRPRHPDAMGLAAHLLAGRPGGRARCGPACRQVAPQLGRSGARGPPQPPRQDQRGGGSRLAGPRGRGVT